MSDAKPVTKPMDKSIFKDSSDGATGAETTFLYREAVGSFMKLPIGSRPDIYYTLGIVSRHLEHPRVPPMLGQSEHILKNEYKAKKVFISTVVDRLFLWWIENPVACISLNHTKSVLNWTCCISFGENVAHIFSEDKAFNELLTISLSNNIWDQLFRITLVSALQLNNITMVLGDLKMSEVDIGMAWNKLFKQLEIFHNDLLISSRTSESYLTVAEQIPVLHRIDHSVHSMRIWVLEESKYNSFQWTIDALFKVLFGDVEKCSKTLLMIDLRVSTIELGDIISTVCLCLRSKLVLEVNINISKLKQVKSECICILSKVCRAFSLANFCLCFPSQKYWRQKHISDLNCSYVSFIFDRILRPVVVATSDIDLINTFFKIICESWIDYIYIEQIKFSKSGAVVLLKHFGEINKWLGSVPEMSNECANALKYHEVQRKCNGIGNILLRKPKQTISMESTNISTKSLPEKPWHDIELPSEMFVPNQVHWLRLRFSSPLCNNE